MGVATRITASLLGVYAGLLGAIHGYHQVLQGSVAPGGPLINAMGPPCRPEDVFHACWPAMTLVPSFLISGLLAVGIGVLLMLWAVFFVGRRRGAAVLAALGVALLLVGGGFLPPLYALLAAAAVSRIGTGSTWWRQRLSGRLGSRLAALWPWVLVVYLAWVAVQLVAGSLLDAMLRAAGHVLLPLELLLLLLSILAAQARDVQVRAAGLPPATDRSRR